MQEQNLTQQLNNYWQNNHFPSSWIIESNDLNKCAVEISNFIKSALELKKFDYHDYPDTRWIALEEKHKYISIKQIQTLQTFIHQSPMVGKNKFAIIEQAQLMNLNASNSCLKLLEDTPDHSYIFLLINSGTSLLPTIESRSFKINIHYQHTVFSRTNEQPPLCNSRLEFINELNSKLDKDKVIEIATRYITALRQIMAFYNQEISNLNSILQQFQQASHADNLISTADKLQKLHKRLDDFIQYDLDGKATLILMSDVIYGKA